MSFLSVGDSSGSKSSPKKTASLLDNWGLTTRAPDLPPDLEFIENGVKNSGDLQRVLALPRRPRPSEAELAQMARGWEEKLGKKTENCLCESKFKRACCRHLLPVQAWALTEASENDGLFGQIGVGHGKTLLNLLVSLVLTGARTAVLLDGVHTAVLLVPAPLKAQLLKVDWHFYGQHWNLPNLAGGQWVTPGRPTLHVLSFNELSTAKNSNVLERINTDVVIIDEAHMLSSSKAARTKRFLRYLESHPQVRVFCWSGTMTRRSIKDDAHLANAALRSGSPRPHEYSVLEEWASCLDPFRLDPTPIGALALFCNPGEDALDGIRRRTIETPGVVTSNDANGCGASLLIRERRVVAPENLLLQVQTILDSAERPDGEQLTDQLSVLRCAKEMSCGFFYRWRWPRREPVPVIEKWLAVRKEWHKEIRNELKRNREWLDSPLLLTRAAIRWHDGYVHTFKDADGNTLERKEYPPHTKNGPLPTWASEYWPAWRETRNTAHPESTAVWVNEYLVEDASKWLEEGPGLAWYEFSAFGQRLAEKGHFTFVGAGAEGNDACIALTGSERVVISQKAHGTGKNLQMFDRCLVTSPSAAGDQWEQLLGRCHRQGQMSDSVTFDVYQHTQVFRQCLDKARELGSFIERSYGAEQKLVSRATWALDN